MAILEPVSTAVSSRLNLLGQLRDLIFVGAGTSYVLGYVVWEVHAWRYNLGLLPLIESQYFAAGLVPVVALAFEISVVLLLGKLYREAAQLFKQGVGGFPKKLKQWAWLVPVVNMTALLLSAVFFDKFPSGWLATPILILFPLWPLSIWFYFWTLSSDTWMGRFAWLYSVCIISATLFIIVYFYTIVVFPGIPHEFGGGEVRCAELEIAPNQLSGDTINELLSEDNADSSGIDIIRTPEVDVYFSGRASLLIKPTSQSQADQGQVYEIDRSLVQTIIWCN